jgi:hypothetical protein
VGTINHVYTNPQADVGDPTIVQPSNWNSVHAYTLQDGVSLSGNTAGALANISSGTLVLAGGNNITLSQNGNSVTVSGANLAQTEQTQSRFNLTLSGNTAGALALISSGVMTLAGGNNISLSQNGNAVTISGPATAAQTEQTQSRFNLTLAGNTAGALALVSSGVMTLAGGNNVTLSQAGNAITVSGAATVAQTVQTQNVWDLTLGGNTAGVGALISSGTMTLVGGNNVTLSQVGNAITVSAAATVAQTEQTQSRFNLTIGGNTAGAGALISSGVMTLAGGNNITVSQAGNAVTISAGTGAGGPSIATTVSSVATANSAGTVTRYAPEDHAHEGVYAVGVSTGGNTAGNTTVQPGRVVLAGGNNITLSVSTAANALQTITISAGAGGGGPSIATSVESVASASSVGTVTRYAPEDHRHEGLYAGGVSTGGNTAGNTTVQPGRLVFAGGNNITLSVGTAAGALQTVTISAAAMAAIHTTVKSVATANSVGTVTRYAAEDHAHEGVYAAGVSNVGNTAGNTTVQPGRFVLAGGNNVTLSVGTAANALMTVTISAANETQTVPPIATTVKSVLTANSVGTVTRFAAEDHGHEGVFAGGVSNVGNTAGNTTVQPGRIVFAGGNNITLSVGTAAGALQTITISAANETQTVPPIATTVNSVATANSAGTVTRFAAEDHRHEGVYAVGVSNVGNTSGNTTVQAGRVVLAGGNNITLSVGTAANALQTITISAGAGGGGPSIATSVESVASASSVGTVTRYAPEDHRHEGLYKISIAGNTAGNTSAGGGSFALAGGPNITLSGSTAAGGMTVSISGGAGAGGGAFTAGVSTDGNTAGTTGTVSSQVVFVGGSNITLSQSVNAQSATITIHNTNAPTPYFFIADKISGSATPFTARPYIMHFFMPTEMTMSRACFAQSLMGTSQGTTATSNTTFGATWSRGVGLYRFDSAADNLTLVSSVSTADSYTWTSNGVTSMVAGGARLDTIPFNATMASPGNYWLAFSMNQSMTRLNSTGGTVSTSMANSYYLGANWNQAPNLFGYMHSAGGASSTNMMVIPFQMLYSANMGGNTFPSTIGSNELVNTNSAANLWFRLDGNITG